MPFDGGWSSPRGSYGTVGPLGYRPYYSGRPNVWQRFGGAASRIGKLSPWVTAASWLDDRPVKSKPDLGKVNRYRLKHGMDPIGVHSSKKMPVTRSRKRTRKGVMINRGQVMSPRTRVSTGGRLIGAGRGLRRNPLIIRPAIKYRPVEKTPYRKIHRGKKKFTDFWNKKGVTVAEDLHGQPTATRTVYFGHYTHPHKAVLQVICHALAKHIGLKCFKHRPASMEDQLGGDNSKSGTQFWFIIVYQDNEEAVSMTEDVGVVISGASTYLQLSIIIRDRLYAIIGDTANTQKRVFDSFKVVQDDTDTAGPTSFLSNMAPLTMKAAEMEFVVKGYSEMKYQNSTLSAGTGGSSDRHDINANPLEGKIYDGRGSYFRIKRDDLDIDNYQGSLSVESQFGSGSFDPSGFLDGEIGRMLEHPASFKTWYGLKSDRYIRMQPGTMYKSVLKKTHKLRFNTWIRIYSRMMRGSLGFFDTNSQPTSIGTSRWFGLDKMIHDSADPSTVVNTETHVEVSAYLVLKRRAIHTAVYPSIPSSA
jgi:hypothetical protein